MINYTATLALHVHLLKLFPSRLCLFVHESVEQMQGKFIHTAQSIPI